MTAESGFDALGLSAPVLRAVRDVGYETPSPIQQLIIPHILEGADVIGQAQTGTGKTGAFALPLLTRMDKKAGAAQVLVLTPTRELAIQVAEAFQRYASNIHDFHVLPIYGGAGYGGQLRQLKRGVHVIVGTPGRLCDHLRRGTLDLGQLKTLVIDEADEMLRMGFIEEVEWILEHTPAERQVALFSATMPKPIRAIAQKYLREPREITIKAEERTAASVRQRHWMVSGMHKLDALTRILEGEEFEAMIVFVRTKNATTDLAARLEARGFSASPLNGDIAQNKREETVERLRKGELDILVATDVAARGLDVQRISHVINYDIPHDTESYIHRIGRTGRAGRTGEAILFVAPRERRLLASIENATRQKIELMHLPTREHINDQRIARFKQRIVDALAVEDGSQFYQEMLEDLREELNIPAIELAAALAQLLHGDEPLIPKREEFPARPEKPSVPARESKGRYEQPKDAHRPPDKDEEEEDIPFERFVLDVGTEHGATAAKIVGAIANEAGLEGRYIRRLRLEAETSTVELPAGMPREIFRTLKEARVAGRPLAIDRLGPATSSPFKREGGFAKKKPGGPKKEKKDFKKDFKGGFKKDGFKKKGFKKAKPGKKTK